MSLQIILTYNIDRPFKVEYLIQIPLQDNTLKSFTSQKEYVKSQKKEGQMVDVISIKIGSKMYTKDEVQNQKIEELLLSRFISTLEYVKENSIIKSDWLLSIQVSHSTIPVISPLLNWMQDIKQLKELEIESAQPFTEEQNVLFMQILSEKLLNLSILHYSVAQTKNQASIIQQPIMKQKQGSVEEITFSEIAQIEDLKILQSFSNLHTIKLSFPLIANAAFIDQALVRVSELVPSTKTLELKLENHTPCSLSQIRNFTHLQNIKIVAKNAIELNLSNLKELTSISIEQPNPLAFFSKQERLENLSSLSLFNVGEVSKGQIVELKNSIQQYQKAVLLHRNLNSLVFSSQGYSLSTQQLVMRDLEVVSVIVNSLKSFSVELIPPSNHVTRKEIDEKLVSMLCQLLDKCKQEIRINYSFETSYISKKCKCDLGLAIRRLPHSDLFSLNGIQIMQFMMRATNFTYQMVSIQTSSLQDNQDYSIFLIYLGVLTSKLFLDKIIYLGKEYIQVLKEIKDRDTADKVREILVPFKRMCIEKIEMEVSEYFSRDLIFIKIGNEINLKIIDSFTDAFPKLLQISGHCELKNIIPKVSTYFPKRNLELRIQLKSYSYEAICKIVQIPGHIFRISSFHYNFYSLDEIKKIIELIAESNFKILFFYKISKNLQKLGNMLIPEFSFSVYEEMIKIHAFNLIISDLLPFNPHTAYLDLYFQ